MENYAQEGATAIMVRVSNLIALPTTVGFIFVIFFLPFASSLQNSAGVKFVVYCDLELKGVVERVS